MKEPNKSESRSRYYFRQILLLVDNMERSAELGFDIGYEARTLLDLIEQYGDLKALEAKISMGYKPEPDEVPF